MFDTSEYSLVAAMESSAAEASGLAMDLKYSLATIADQLAFMSSGGPAVTESSYQQAMNHAHCEYQNAVDHLHNFDAELQQLLALRCQFAALVDIPCRLSVEFPSLS